MAKQSQDGKAVKCNMTCPLPLRNDDYRQFLTFSGLNVVVYLDYSVPGLVLADEKTKSKSCIPGQDLNTEHSF